MSTRTSVSQALRIARYAHALLGVALTAFCVLLLVNAFALTVFRVDGHSMDITLQDGQLLGVDLVSFRFSQPKDNQIVILQFSGDEDVRFVKRVVGVPGDKVEYKGQTITLAADQFFVEGDNRDHSTDSRAYGPVRRNEIVGRVIAY